MDIKKVGLDQGESHILVRMYPEIGERMAKIRSISPKYWSDKEIDLYCEAERELESEGWRPSESGKYLKELNFDKEVYHIDIGCNHLCDHTDSVELNTELTAEENAEIKMLGFQFGKDFVENGSYKFRDFFEVLVNNFGEGIISVSKAIYFSVMAEVSDEILCKMDNIKYVREYGTHTLEGNNKESYSGPIVTLVYLGMHNEVELRLAVTKEEYQKFTGVFQEMTPSLLERIEEQANSHPTYQEAIYRAKLSSPIAAENLERQVHLITGDYSDEHEPFKLFDVLDENSPMTEDEISKAFKKMLDIDLEDYRRRNGYS